MSDIIDVEAKEVPDTAARGAFRLDGLTPEQIADIEKIKTTGLMVGELIDAITQMESAKCTTQSSTEQLTAATEAMRWASIAKTHLQQGFMALTRAVAKPEGF